MASSMTEQMAPQTAQQANLIPVVTPEEMAAIDAAASDPVEVLISRAGEAVAREAREMLGKVYGRQVLVVAGKGNNGKDGISAGKRLRHWGAQVMVIEPNTRSELPKAFRPDLVIDAAYGTGLTRPYTPPEFLKSLGCATLSVDIPSGVSGLTGEVLGEALPAECTVTFAALKPGLLFAEGKRLSGEVVVVDIGLEVGARLSASGELLAGLDVAGLSGSALPTSAPPASAPSASAHLLTKSSLTHLLPKRDLHAHKWQAACWVIGGSPGMSGAPSLASKAAFRAGAGYVRVSIPPNSAEISPDVAPEATPLEAVGFALPERNWAETVIAASDKFKSLVVGPGLPATSENSIEIAKLLSFPQVLSGKIAMVVDGGALEALGTKLSEKLSEKLKGSNSKIVLTPHDKEYEYLAGHPPSADRIASARQLAKSTGTTVLLKGSTTAVANPQGQVLLSASGDQRLATAGTGDVLSGIIGSLLAQGLDTLTAAATAAELHSQAAQQSHPQGLIASDIPTHLPKFLPH